MNGGVAADPQSVAAALTDPTLRVRPNAEPVPAVLAGHPLAGIFARLVRMIDGADHDRLKAAIAATFAELDNAIVEAAAGRSAAAAVAAALPWTGAALDAYCATVPTRTIAELLGFRDAQADDASAWGRQCARAISPAATTADVDAARYAATALRAALDALPRKPGTLMHRLAAHGKRYGIDDDGLVANAAGFFTQAHDATTGLIANAIALLLEQRATPPRDGDIDEALGAVVREISPVRNTRRFTPDGSSIVVDIAAANKSVASTADAFTFGRGAHACPGMQPALAIAGAAVRCAFERGVGDAGIAAVGDYPYSNVLVRRFGP